MQPRDPCLPWRGHSARPGPNSCSGDASGARALERWVRLRGLRTPIRTRGQMHHSGWGEATGGPLVSLGTRQTRLPSRRQHSRCPGPPTTPDGHSLVQSSCHPPQSLHSDLLLGSRPPAQLLPLETWDTPRLTDCAFLLRLESLRVTKPGLWWLDFPKPPSPLPFHPCLAFQQGPRETLFFPGEKACGELSPLTAGFLGAAERWKRSLGPCCLITFGPSLIRG